MEAPVLAVGLPIDAIDALVQVMRTFPSSLPILSIY